LISLQEIKHFIFITSRLANDYTAPANPKNDEKEAFGDFLMHFFFAVVS